MAIKITSPGLPLSGGTLTGGVTAPNFTVSEALGSEVLTQTAAGWGLSSPVGAWSASGNTITRTASGSDLTITNSAAVVGTTYKVVIVTATVTAGSVTPSFGGVTGTAISTATTTTAYYTATATTAFTLTASATFAGTITISTTSVKSVTSGITNDTGTLKISSVGSIRLLPASGSNVILNATLAMSPQQDVLLSRNADGILQLKSDGTSAAEFRVYGDGTTAAKYIAVKHDGTSSYIANEGGNRITIGANGNVAVAAPTSGTALVATGVTNANALQGTGTGATSAALRGITDTGYGAYITSTAAAAVPLLYLGPHSSTTGPVTTIATSTGAEWRTGQATELITLNTGAATTDSTADLLPANSIIEAVVARVTTTITTAANWRLGDATTSDRFTAANSTLTAGTTDVGLRHQQGSIATDATGPVQTAAAKVRITLNANPGAGVIRVTVFYRQFVAPTS